MEQEYIEQQENSKETAYRSPKNLFLKILVFFGVFLLTQIVESLILLKPMMEEIYQQLIDASIDGNNSFAILAYFEQYGFQYSQNIMILMLYATIPASAVILLYAKFEEKREMRSLGFQKKGMLKEYAIGFGLGFLFMSVLVLSAVFLGGFEIQKHEFHIGTVLLILVGFLFQGMEEEILCRGWLMNMIGQHHKQWVAVLVSSLLFAILHGANSGLTPLAFLNLTLYAVFAGLYYLWRGNIWGIAAFHSAWNFFQGAFYGVNVSGTIFDDKIFNCVQKDVLLSGGAFGIEGSLITTLVLTLSSLFIWLKYREKCNKM